MRMKEARRELGTMARRKRCKDCDPDCWDVPSPLACWIGNENTEPVDGLCPWVHDGIDFPPRP